ncbi:VOC family protein [Saccharomonospora sp. NPDC006951]
MTIQLNHTIVPSRDKKTTATFVAEILGLGAPEPFGPFLVVKTENEVSLDFMDTAGDIPSLHYAFLVSEQEFDEIFGRSTEAGIGYWADPGHGKPGEINHGDGGRGVYFEGPDGQNLEILTRPYGSG